jgi:hypothetical protein
VFWILALEFVASGGNWSEPNLEGDRGCVIPAKEGGGSPQAGLVAIKAFRRSSSVARIIVKEMKTTAPTAM